MNRRIFLQSMVSVSASAAIAGKPGSVAYRYIGNPGHIDVFRVDGKRSRLVQRMPSRAPVSLLLHPNRQVLYAANHVALHEGLPRGTVEVFSVDRQTGALALLQRRALSLSGTQPRALAIAPDARYLVAAVYGGGAYNVLPIEQNGSLSEVSGIFKDLGRGPHSEHQLAAHPHTVIFDAAGRFVLSSDLGCDRLSVFAIIGEGELQRMSKLSVAPGSGPGCMAAHPGGSWLYVMHQLKPAISCHRYRPTEGIIEPRFQHVTLNDNGTGLTIDGNGRFLYAASESKSTSFSIDSASGALRIAASIWPAVN
jgi:6-phosphogluconolactonase (cycloisomerase 2 family)